MVQWTARAAMLFYFVALCLLICRRDQRSRGRRLHLARWAWTVAAGIYLLHVGCAFQFVRHWSHYTAYQFTAQQTAQAVGLRWGGGLYFNYLFTAVWLADVIWWWIDERGYLHRPRWLSASIHGFMFFMAFNATIVFGGSNIRWWGVGAVVVLMIMALMSRMRESTEG